MNQMYDITPDGKRFVMIRDGDPQSRRINVVIGWLNEFRQLAGAAGD